MSELLPLEQALATAGKPNGHAERVQRLQNRRITLDTILPKMVFLFQLFGKPCFPRGELVAVTGKAKSGKTFFTTMLMALCAKTPLLGIKRLLEEPLRLLWIDTEQSEESTQDILKNRLIPLTAPTESPPPEESPPVAEPPPRPDIFNLRGESWKDRAGLLESAVLEYHPDLVILDGIRDLVNDINDGVLAQETIEELMQLASEVKCCMVCVLHQNKSSEDKNLRGWIGTELMNKAFEVYSCEKLSDRLFTVEQTATRKYDILDKLQFMVNDQGIPFLPNADELSSSRQKAALQSTGRPQFTEDYIVHHDDGSWNIDVARLFTDAFGGAAELPAGELEQRVRQLSHIVSDRFYLKQRATALRENVIVRKPFTAPGGEYIFALGTPSGARAAKAAAASRSAAAPGVTEQEIFDFDAEGPVEGPAVAPY